ncbi:MAG: hypothetical protein Q9186_007593 [Xanthomendoza sp. 1 TL-2023]
MSSAPQTLTQTPGPTVAQFPNGNIVKSTFWPQYRYGMGSGRDDITQAQLTILMTTVTELRDSVRNEIDRWRDWEEERGFRMDKLFELTAAHARTSGVEEAVITAARPNAVPKQLRRRTQTTVRSQDHRNKNPHVGGRLRCECRWRARRKKGRD